MHRKKRLPADAKLRTCLSCGRVFKAMTDRQWRNVKVIHDRTSLRHR